MDFRVSLQRGETAALVRDGLAREGILIFWYGGTMVLWCSGDLVPWYDGIVAAWCHGIMVFW